MENFNRYMEGYETGMRKANIDTSQWILNMLEKGDKKRTVKNILTSYIKAETERYEEFTKEQRK